MKSVTESTPLLTLPIRGPKLSLRPPSLSSGSLMPPTSRDFFMLPVSMSFTSLAPVQLSAMRKSSFGRFWRPFTVLLIPSMASPMVLPMSLKGPAMSPAAALILLKSSSKLAAMDFSFSTIALPYQEAQAAMPPGTRLPGSAMAASSLSLNSCMTPLTLSIMSPGPDLALSLISLSLSTNWDAWSSPDSWTSACILSAMALTAAAGSVMFAISMAPE
mmetsp:Transcript_401/g.957  ORF Transcript_401/g.957 Transcript_401/m.957 type:complete len:217 (-) Transcript_401:77-727(-)